MMKISLVLLCVGVWAAAAVPAPGEESTDSGSSSGSGDWNAWFTACRADPSKCTSGFPSEVPSFPSGGSSSYPTPDQLYKCREDPTPCTAYFPQGTSSDDMNKCFQKPAECPWFSAFPGGSSN